MGKEVSCFYPEEWEKIGLNEMITFLFLRWSWKESETELHRLSLSVTTLFTHVHVPCQGLLDTELSTKSTTIVEDEGG